MRRLARHLAALVFLLILSPSVAADAPQFTGRWQQGALLVGTVEPGSSVRFAERDLSVDPRGQFALGLAYDAPAAAVIDVRTPQGVSTRHEYAVEQRSYDVQKIGGLPKGMVEPPAAVLARIEKEQKLVARARTADTARSEFASRFAWPLAATVTGVYGSARVLNGVSRQPHFGVDLAASQGTPIRAPGGGTVRLAQADLYYTGGTIILDHGHGLTTTYLHLSRLDVMEGQNIAPGQVIGLVGKTGRATGPHLCWRANWFDVRLDPSLLAQANPALKGEKVK